MNDQPIPCPGCGQPLQPPASGENEVWCPQCQAVIPLDVARFAQTAARVDPARVSAAVSNTIQQSTNRPYTVTGRFAGGQKFENTLQAPSARDAIQAAQYLGVNVDAVNGRAVGKPDAGGVREGSSEAIDRQNKQEERDRRFQERRDAEASAAEARQQRKEEAQEKRENLDMLRRSREIIKEMDAAAAEVGRQLREAAGVRVENAREKEHEARRAAHEPNPREQVFRAVARQTRVGRAALRAYDATVKPFRDAARRRRVESARQERRAAERDYRTAGRGGRAAGAGGGGAGKPPGGSGARTAAGGLPPGAGGAAGSVGAEAAGAEAVGGGAAAATAAEAIPVVGIIVAATLALVELAKQAKEAAYQQEQANRQLAEFSPSQAGNAGFLDAQRAVRSFETGEATAGTGQGLNEALDRWEAATQPIDQLSTNLKNLIGTGVMTVLARIAELLTPAVEALNKLVGFKPENTVGFDQWLGEVSRQQAQKEQEARDRIARARRNAAGFD